MSRKLIEENATLDKETLEELNYRLKRRAENSKRGFDEAFESMCRNYSNLKCQHKFSLFEESYMIGKTNSEDPEISENIVTMDCYYRYYACKICGTSIRHEK